VQRIEYDPNRSARIALVKYGEGEQPNWQLAHYSWASHKQIPARRKLPACAGGCPLVAGTALWRLATAVASGHSVARQHRPSL
jgi:ribosomal protein L2